MGQTTTTRLGFTITFITSALSLTILSFILTACGSSEETETSSGTPAVGTLAMRHELDSVKAENLALQDQIEKSRQDNRALTARAAELETQLSDAHGARSDAPPMQVSVNPPKSELSPGEGNPLYERGLSLFMGRRYMEATQAFEEFLRLAAPEVLQDNAQYWIGECLYAQRKYTAAIDAFRLVLSFSNGDKADDAQMMIAQSCAALGKKKQAKEEFEKLIASYPNSPFVKLAKARLAKL